MKLVGIYWILLAAASSAIDVVLSLSEAIPPTYTCNITTYETLNCTGQQLDQRLSTVFDYFDAPCGYGYDATFMECCVNQNAPALLAENATNVTFFSCSRDEMPPDPLINISDDDVPVDGFIILFVAMLLMILLPAAWCCYRCYRQSKQASLEQHQQERNDGEDATVPDDDSLSMVSI